MPPSATADGAGRRRELGAFLFLTVVLFPVLAVLLVSAFGFAVWTWQMIFGPPGV
ncbi:MAG: periplasmic nitrate reductase, NapE protein [Xanthomonadales bacterium]|nr:periplasmic nitrate reductase, NapE protein [Xanthomonadales bacterium]